MMRLYINIFLLCVLNADSTVASKAPVGKSGTVRLVDQQGPLQGRVELLRSPIYAPIWDYICFQSDEFDDYAAALVCGDFGWIPEVDYLFSYPNGFYGQYVSCSGEEESILDCRYKNRICESYHSVGVRCRQKLDCSRMGYYLAHNDCKECPFGQYKNESVSRTTCYSCKSGQTTPNKGSTSVEDCYNVTLSDCGLRNPCNPLLIPGLRAYPNENRTLIVNCLPLEDATNECRITACDIGTLYEPRTLSCVPE